MMVNRFPLILLIKIAVLLIKWEIKYSENNICDMIELLLLKNNVEILIWEWK